MTKLQLIFGSALCDGWGSALYAHFWVFAIVSLVGARLQAKIDRLERGDDVR